MKQIKAILISIAGLLTGMIIYGQAREASVMIDDQNRNAVMINIDRPDKITGEALQLRFERSGLKDKARNGILRFKGVTLSEISPNKVDIYTKVEKGPNNSSVVYMAVSTGYNNFSNSSADSSITQNVKIFLESLIKDANDHFADVGISNQINDVSKDEKSYQDLLDEQRDLEKKKSTIDSRLIAIQMQLNIMREGINLKKSGLDDAKAKRSKPDGQ